MFRAFLVTCERELGLSFESPSNHWCHRDSGYRARYRVRPNDPQNARGLDSLHRTLCENWMRAKCEDSVRSFFLAESGRLGNCPTGTDYVVGENRISPFDIQASDVYFDLRRRDSSLVKDGVFRAQFLGHCCCPGLRFLVRPDYDRVPRTEIILSVSSE